ncbi:MAG: membrane fusion protein (multidrug efflux system) [Saprospiraceae bacterium]|jgi:membrane fusion protein (multidrug efflux system)
MKYLSPLLLIVLLAIACQPEATYPVDLAGKQVLLKEKEKELKELNKLIGKLEQEVDSLDPNSKKEKPRTLVTTQKVERKTFERFVNIQSNVQSDDIVMASSETGGRLISVTVEEGTNVRKGQLIAKVDMEGVDKQIAELNKSLELAADIYDRQKRLWDQNIGSEIQYLQAKNGKERIEKSLETTKFQLTKANVYAPISGVVDMVYLKSGEMAGPGVPIAQIISTGTVKVVADVPEKYLKAIKRGEMVTIKFPALDMETKAKVSLIGNTINPANRTFKVEVNVPNQKSLLKPNLLANMLLNDFTQKDAVVVPLELVQQEVSGRSYVYIKGVNEEGEHAKKMMVETGESYEGGIIILSGLEGGEEIIVRGARGLAKDELIKIIKPTTAENNG